MKTLFLPALAPCLLLAACAAPPELTGYPANTPAFYSEDKLLFFGPLAGEDRLTAETVPLLHLYEVDAEARAEDVIKHHDPVAVVLQGVRIPESLPGGRRDIAVVLDIHMSAQEGLQSLVVFYQRDVPPGQMLNFNNLLVYAESQWDSSTPPYFRVRVLDVKAERNQRTEQLLQSASQLAGEISGLVPHPIIPVVGRAIQASQAVLSNRRNEVLMDYQVNLFADDTARNAGDADLGRLLAGRWMVLGRARDQGSDFWNRPLQLHRKTDQILSETGEPVPVPYVTVAIVRDDLQVPKFVMEKSSALIQLLSSPAGKTDTESMEAAIDLLGGAVKAYAAERRLIQYRSKQDLSALVAVLSEHNDALADGRPGLSVSHVRRLTRLYNQATGQDLSSIDEIVRNWVEISPTGRFTTDPAAPLGAVFHAGE